MQRLCLVEDDDIMRASLCQRFKLEAIVCDCFDNALEASTSLNAPGQGAVGSLSRT